MLLLCRETLTSFSAFTVLKQILTTEELGNCDVNWVFGGKHQKMHHYLILK